jgi:hypothetical protein
MKYSRELANVHNFQSKNLGLKVVMILNRFLNKKLLSACFHGVIYIYVYICISIYTVYIYILLDCWITGFIYIILNLK